MATRSDVQVAALAGGFTLGFGFLTVWEAIKQTRRNRNPLRSIYIYMVWGEIIANIGIGVLGWIFLDGVIGPTVPVLFFILLCWVFQIQLLMQIIINRIALIAEHRSTIQRLKWGTVGVISAINIAVFIIWIPAHTMPPASDLFVAINNVWDKVSKVLILIVDAGLNWYFLRTVKNRLVEQHGLVKYQPLVGFNAKLMVVSIAMDGMLIGTMFLKNQVVYIQFHPVCYIVKLNIEMSMASLVVRLARGKTEHDDDGAMPERYYPHHSSSHDGGGGGASAPQRSVHAHHELQNYQLNSVTAKGGAESPSSASLGKGFDDENVAGGIRCRTDLHVVTERIDDGKGRDDSGVRCEGASSRSSNEASIFGDDEVPLHQRKSGGVRVTEAQVV